MYNPISSEFFDQLIVAMERKIPSTIEYYQNVEQEERSLVKHLKTIPDVEKPV